MGQDEVFAGTTPYTGARPTLSPIQEATLCKQQADKQREDAETRNIVWSGENSLELDDPDADCDDDPDYIRLPDGRYEKIDAMSPIGIRNKDGNIESIAYTVPEQPSEAQFGGFSENVPIRLQDIACPFLRNDFSILITLTPKRPMVGFPKIRPLRKRKPFYSHRRTLACILLLPYMKTIFISTSSLDVATVIRRLPDVITNIQCTYAYK